MKYEPKGQGQSEGGRVTEFRSNNGASWHKKLKKASGKGYEMKNFVIRPKNGLVCPYISLPKMGKF